MSSKAKSSIKDYSGLQKSTGVRERLKEVTQAALKLQYLLGIHYRRSIAEYVSGYVPVRTHRKVQKKKKKKKRKKEKDNQSIPKTTKEQMP